MDAGIIKGDEGFSLLELMVSVAVLAVLAVGAGLAAGSSVPPAARDAERFRRAYEQNWAIAILSREPRGLIVTPNAVFLSRKSSEGWDRGARLYDWRGRAQFLGAGPPPLQGAPDIVMSPDASSTAFSVVFDGRRSDAWRCTTDGWSELTCAAE